MEYPDGSDLLFMFSKPICMKLEKEFSLGFAYQPSILINNKINTNNHNGDDNCPRILSTKAVPNSLKVGVKLDQLILRPAQWHHKQRSACLWWLLVMAHGQFASGHLYNALKWRNSDFFSFFIFVFIIVTILVSTLSHAFSHLISAFIFYFSLGWSDSNCVPKLKVQTSYSRWYNWQ